MLALVAQQTRTAKVAVSSNGLPQNALTSAAVNRTRGPARCLLERREPRSAGGGDALSRKSSSGVPRPRPADTLGPAVSSRGRVSSLYVPDLPSSGLPVRVALENPFHAFLTIFRSYSISGCSALLLHSLGGTAANAGLLAVLDLAAI